MFLKIIFVAVMFFILTPGIVVRLPPKGSLKVVALVHSLIFAFIVGMFCRMIDSLDKKRYKHSKKESFATPRAACLEKDGKWNAMNDTCT